VHKNTVSVAWGNAKNIGDYGLDVSVGDRDESQFGAMREPTAILLTNLRKQGLNWWAAEVDCWRESCPDTYREGLGDSPKSVA